MKHGKVNEGILSNILRLLMAKELERRLDPIVSQIDDAEAQKSAAIIKHQLSILDSKVRAICKAQPSHPWCKYGNQLVKAKWR